MEMPLLISSENFAPYKTLSANLPKDKLEPYIREAQDFDLRKALGDVFYYDFVKNRSAENYQDLLNGKEYQNAAGETLYFNGVASALVYLTYARMSPHIDVHSTATGLVTKTTEFTAPLSEARTAKISSQASEGADTILRDTIKFLEANLDAYPKYKSCSIAPSQSGVIITKVSKYKNR